MSKKKEEAKPRTVRMGATISLPAYSSLRIEVAEPVEGEGLDINKTALYLKNIAKSLGGTLALPALDGEKAKNKAKKVITTQADFFGRQMEYDEALHSYTVEGKNFISATTLVDAFYPMHDNKFIAPEYLENAAQYGSFVHKILENALKGYVSAKPSIKKMQTQVVDYIDTFRKNKDDELQIFTEQMIFDTDFEIAGRFDALVNTTLFDWKTNNDMFGKKECLLPQELIDKFADVCNLSTTWGSYVLQQNFYAYMLNKIKPNTVTKSIIAWAQDLDQDIRFLEVPLLKPEEVELFLNEHKKASLAR